LRGPECRDQNRCVDALTNFTSSILSRVPPILVAPFIGSFLGVLILRLPEGRPIATGRSVCDHCGHRLGVRDLIPFVSYALSKGRCRYCGQAIGSFPIMIELAALAVAAWAATVTAGTEIWLACLLGWALLTAAWIDIRTMILPDALTLPLLAAGLIVTAVTDPDSLTDHALAAALGSLLLFATARAYRLLRGRDGLGLGDAKLLAALGAWIGLSDLPVVLLLASCLGLAAAGAGRLLGKRVTAATAIPFGPFLSLAGWLAWLYADWFNRWLGDVSFGYSL
jgi:leader peptidase (prepilin peptidase)/N-methyltransferase